MIPKRGTQFSDKIMLNKSNVSFRVPRSDRSRGPADRASQAWRVPYLAALQERKIAGAALDVFASEPNIDARFLTLDNVVLQPHSASITHETRAAMLARLIGDIAAYAAGRPFHNAAATA